MEKKYNSLEDIDSEIFRVYIDGELYGEIGYKDVYEMERSRMVSKFSRPAREKFEHLRKEYKRIFYGQADTTKRNGGFK